MAENRTLATIRLALVGLPDSAPLLDHQAGLVVRLANAASLIGEDIEDVASALAIGLLEAKEMHERGETNFPRYYLAVLRAGRALGLRQSGSAFKRCGKSALADSLECDTIHEQAHFDDPAAIIEAFQAVSSLDSILISSQLADAERESIGSSLVAQRAGITTRAARYRIAKAHVAASKGQGDLFGGLLV
jgi:hypothetical protein